MYTGISEELRLHPEMKQTYFLHLIVLFMNISKSLSQQCTTSYIQKYLDGKLAETDYRPLLSLEGNNYG